MRKFNLKAKDKLIITILNIIFMVSIGKGRYAVLALFGALAIITAVLFKPHFKKLAKKVPLVFLYPLFVSIFIPFTLPGEVLASLDLGLFAATVTDNGITTFYTILIKSFLSILLVASLTLSTDEKELFHGLRKLRVPAIMVTIMFVMYRYIFLIREESKTGQMAINSRVFKKSYYAKNRKLSYLMGNMLIKSFDRAENIYRSMESRGFCGEFHVYEKSIQPSSSGTVLLILSVIVPVLLKIIEITEII
ncbi:MAG: cobalt ECF transporter T component CbiQ [Actinomycetota bacterium]